MRPTAALTPASSQHDRLGRTVLLALGIALALALGPLAGVSGSTATAATVADEQRPGAWLRPLESWLAPVEGWLDASLGADALSDDVPEVTTIRLKPRPKRGPFSMNLYEQGDFVNQKTVYWCVSASVQTMINIMEDGKPRRGKQFQRKLHFQARRLDQDEDDYWRQRHGPVRWQRGLHGLGVSDWAELLTTRGHGEFEVDRAPKLKKAIRKAAKAIRTTGKPVGLVVWRGAHAWVMSGFTATADPALTNDFKIKRVFVHDPWYPMVSSIWGHSRPPNAAVTLKQLSQDYLRYNRPGRRHPMRDGKYIMVLPKLPPGTKIR